MEDGRLVYESDEQYFYEAAIQFVKEGSVYWEDVAGQDPNILEQWLRR